MSSRDRGRGNSREGGGGGLASTQAHAPPPASPSCGEPGSSPPPARARATCTSASARRRSAGRACQKLCVKSCAAARGGDLALFREEGPQRVGAWRAAARPRRPSGSMAARAAAASVPIDLFCLLLVARRLHGGGARGQGRGVGDARAARARESAGSERVTRAIYSRGTVRGTSRARESAGSERVTRARRRERSEPPTAGRTAGSRPSRACARARAPGQSALAGRSTAAWAALA